MYKVERYNRDPFTKKFMEIIVVEDNQGEIREAVDEYLMKEFGGKVDEVRISTSNTKFDKTLRILVWGKLL